MFFAHGLTKDIGTIGLPTVPTDYETESRTTVEPLHNLFYDDFIGRCMVCQHV